MMDHTYCGTPVSQMPQRALDECLDEGFQILDKWGMSENEAAYWVRLRLEIERIRRQLGIAVR
jgi:hypothetical protein